VFPGSLMCSGFSVSVFGGRLFSLPLLGRVVGVVAVALTPAARDTAVAGIGQRSRGRSASALRSGFGRVLPAAAWTAMRAIRAAGVLSLVDICQRSCW
jgi:hypothetical protein